MHEFLREMIRPVALTTAVLLLSISLVLGMTEQSDRNQEAMESYLGPVLNPQRDAARINIVVDCRRGECPQFPRIKMQRPSKGKSGLAAVREIFAKDQRVAVTSSANGVIPINFGKAPSALLQTKIHSLRFTVREQYNIISAEGALEGTKEIKAAVQKLRLEGPVIVISELIQDPIEGVPHLPREVHDITLDQALDLFARTFGQVMLYEECIRPDGTRCFFINHDYVQGGKWFDAIQARWDQLRMQGYKTGVCPVHHVPLQKSIVYGWSHSPDNVPQDPRPQLPDHLYIKREQKYPLHLSLYEKLTASSDFHRRKEETFCPVCQRLFEADLKQSR